MNKNSMTALVSCFSRAYHNENNNPKIFSDSIAKNLISDEEYLSISENMSSGISFFNKDFKGSKEEALSFIVDNFLSPSPLGRSAFTESALEREVTLGTSQYIILAAGYDTFAYRQPDYSKNLKIFEIDVPLMSKDKRHRLIKNSIDIPENTFFIEEDLNNKDWYLSLLTNDNFSSKEKSFCSILGLTYYLPKNSFKSLLKSLSLILPKGSAIVFDYPSILNEKNSSFEKQESLAKESDEEMLSKYDYFEIENILSEYNFLAYSNLTPKEIEKEFFSSYNKVNVNKKIKPTNNVNYCLAIKQ